MVETYGPGEYRLSYVEETNYGETPATPTMTTIMPTQSAEPAWNPNLIKIRGFGSRDIQGTRRGLRMVDMKVAYLLSYKYPVNFLNFAVDLKSMSVELIYYKGAWASATDIISLLHKGCRINRITVECTVEDMVKATAELIGKDSSPGTSKVGDSYTEHGVGEAILAWWHSYVKKDTTMLERASSWKFTIENNLKRVPIIPGAGTGYLLKYLRERHRVLGGEVTFEFESKEEFDDVVNDTEFNLEFGLGTFNTPNDKVTFSNCKWENVGTPTRIEELVSLRAPFVAKSVTITESQ